MDDDCLTLVEDINNDEDPLIAEVDVYLTRIFADQLYLFQYPLRSTHLQYVNDSTFIGARLKPKTKVVQLDYVLDTESDFHCKDNEASVIQNFTSTTADERINSMDRLTLSSLNTTQGDNYKRFAVGLLTPNGIQLSPLNAIFQLRPDFDSTSSVLVRQAAPIEIDEDETESSFHKQSSSNSDDATTDEEANELVTMKFWKPEGRLQRERKMRSYNYFERARNEERWIDFAYYSPNECESIDLRKKWTLMDNDERSRSIIRWRKTISIQDYFQLLIFDKTIIFESPIEKEKPAIESTLATEQKPLVVPPTKPKKKKKTDLDKSSKKLSRKSRTKNVKSTDSTLNPEQTTTTSTPSLPTTIVKQDPEKIQHELLSFMKRRFGYRPYFKLSEINIAIKLELISSPPGHPLASGITEGSILRAVAEIGAIYVNKKWPKNLKQEPVFVNAQMGDKYDVLRRYVAELLEKCDSFQFTELRSRIKQENQTQQFPVHEVKKFVKDHCITRSSRKGVLYCVKGTLVK
ncbi:unnamed protein product [Rotaria socialis]|uniref:Uncharacterized protein n=2 Tax=Rotaria socialis TaxID=392032 RepID=A0A820IEI5_9BILA|nr:unnamed protein product [Rotaria socialis]CAF3237877.1 unnamed protein product [Rotaria socialis]CAF3316380.1 unnamed protein product [Rotaria socialis]CAF4241490.1 unnamed protein product [Rotaria socialis]CAF4307575.1 unnamed protein product [Rotaria socialis]